MNSDRGIRLLIRIRNRPVLYGTKLAICHITNDIKNMHHASVADDVNKSTTAVEYKLRSSHC